MSVAIESAAWKPQKQPITWNALKGSLNLSFQTLGWGSYLVGNNHPLYQGMWENEILTQGYLTIRGPGCQGFLPVIVK